MQNIEQRLQEIITRIDNEPDMTQEEFEQQVRKEQEDMSSAPRL